MDGCTYGWMDQEVVFVYNGDQSRPSTSQNAKGWICIHVNQQRDFRCTSGNRSSAVTDFFPRQPSVSETLLLVPSFLPHSLTRTHTFRERANGGDGGKVYVLSTYIAHRVLSRLTRVTTLGRFFLSLSLSLLPREATNEFGDDGCGPRSKLQIEEGRKEGWNLEGGEWTQRQRALWQFDLIDCAKGKMRLEIHYVEQHPILNAVGWRKREK